MHRKKKDCSLRKINFYLLQDINLFHIIRERDVKNTSKSAYEYVFLDEQQFNEMENRTF